MLSTDCGVTYPKRVGIHVLERGRCNLKNLRERYPNFGLYFREISGNCEATFMYSYYASCCPIDVEVGIGRVQIGGISVFSKEDNA